MNELAVSLLGAILLAEVADIVIGFADDLDVEGRIAWHIE